MAPRIDVATVAHAANLARLRLTEDETDRFATQLDTIMGLFEALDRVDVSSVDPDDRPGGGRNGGSRPDDVGETSEDVETGAPSFLRGHFRVPTVLG